MTEETSAFLRSLHPEIRRKMRAALDLIVSERDAGKSLRHELRGLRSYQIGRFRVIYRVASKRIIEIIAVGPRRTIYEETYRLLKKPPDTGNCVGVPESVAWDTMAREKLRVPIDKRKSRVA